MFLRVGFLIASLLKTRLFKSKKSIIITTILGFILSATIEFSQLFLPRTTSVIDILNNTIGTSLGAFLVYSKNSYNPKLFFNSIFEFMKQHLLTVILGYILFVTIVFSLPPLLNNFNNWNNNYLFQIGNEATKDRPWQGTIFKLSIFNRLLKQKDIDAYYAEGHSQKTGAENYDKPLLEYMFENLPVQNNGSIKEKLFLFPQTNSHVKKIVKQNGIFISDNSILQSQIPGVQLVENLQRTDQLSIAVWLNPQNLKMVGPARIVSLSADPGNRNFTIGQVQDRINFRVRTPLTGNNGSKVSLTSTPILNSRMPQLIVATFYRGETKIYYNGKLNSNFTDDTSSYLPLIIGLKKERYRVISVCFTLLFPLGWLTWGFSSFNFWKRLSLVFCVLIPSLFSSVFNMLFYQHSVDAHLIIMSSVIFFLVVVGGMLCDFFIILLRKYNLS